MVLYIFIFSSLGYLTTDIYLPAMPAISEYFQIHDGLTQLTITIFLLSFGISPIIFGPISDRIGRILVIRQGLIVTLIATILCCLSNNIYLLLFFRFCQGIGVGAVSIASRSILPDLHRGKNLSKQLSYLSMLRPLILAISPVIGGVIIERFNWQIIFVILAIYVLFCLWLSLRVNESANISKNLTLDITIIKQAIKSYKNLLCHKKFMSHGLGTIIPSFAVFGYFTASPFLFESLIELTPTEYGLLSIYLGIGIVICSLINTKLIKLLKIPTIVLIGSNCIFFAGIAISIFDQLYLYNAYAMFIPCIFFFGAIPLVMANSTGLALGFTESNYGTASALLYTLQIISGALGSFTFSVLPETSFKPLGYCIAICGGLCILNYFFNLKIVDRLATDTIQAPKY